MELVILIVFGLIITMFIGAIMGFAAMARVGRVERQLNEFKDEISFDVSFVRKKLARMEADIRALEGRVPQTFEQPQSIEIAPSLSPAPGTLPVSEPLPESLSSLSQAVVSEQVVTSSAREPEVVSVLEPIDRLENHEESHVIVDVMGLQMMEPTPPDFIKEGRSEAVEESGWSAEDGGTEKAAEEEWRSSEVGEAEEDIGGTEEAEEESGRPADDGYAEEADGVTTEDIGGAEEAEEVSPALIPPTESIGTEQEPVESDRDWWSMIEDNVGKRWITWAGALALVVGAGFFVRHAMDQGWLGPWWRVGLSMLMGVSLVLGGVRFMIRQMRPLGQGLVGGGLGILYGAIYAAYGYYGLVPNIPAFVVMIAVTALGMWLAVRCDAKPIAFLSVIGGVLTPIMLWPEIDPGHGLFAYLLCLDLGVLYVAFSKRWRALDLLAMAGTSFVFLSWHSVFFDEREYLMPLSWLGAFALVFLATPFVFHMRHRTTVARERLAMALTSGCGVFAYAMMIIPQHPYLLGGVAFALSVVYLTFAWLTHRRIPSDRHARLSLVTLSIAFFTVALPIVLDFHAVTMAWAMEGVVLVYLGARYRYLPDRVFGLLAFGAAVVRTMFLEWPRVGSTGGTPFWNADLGSALFVALAGGALGLVYHLHRAEVRPVEGMIKRAVLLYSVFMGIIACNSELWWVLVDVGSSVTLRWSSALLWIAGGCSLLLAGLGLRSLHARIAGLVALLVAVVFICWDYSLGWPTGSLIVINGRFLAGILVSLLFAGYSIAYLTSPRCSSHERKSAVPVLGVAIASALILGSFEAFQGFLAMGLSDQARAVPVLAWVGGAALCLVLSGHAWTGKIFWLSLASLTVASVLALISYQHELAMVDAVLGVNLRYGASLSVGVLLLIAGLWLKRGSQDDEHSMSQATFCAGLLIIGFFTTIELWAWLSNVTAAFLSAMVWAATAVVLFVTGLRFRSVNSRIVAWATLVLSSAFVVWDFVAIQDGSWIGEQLFCFNGVFLAGVTVNAVLFGFAFTYWKERHLFTEIEVLSVETAIGLGLVLTPVVLSAELASHYGFDGLSRFTIIVTWVIGAVLSLVASRKERIATLRWLGLLHALVASVIVGFWFRSDLLTESAMVVLNLRFAAAVVVALLLLFYGLWIRRKGSVVEAWEEDIRALGHSLVGIGIAGFVLCISFEVWDWLDCCPGSYGLANVLIALAWAVGSASVLVTGIKLESSGLRRAGLVLLTVASVAAVFCYTFPLSQGAILVLNSRFAAAALVVLMIFLFGIEVRVRSSRGDEGSGDLRKESSVLFGVGTTLAVTLFSFETFRFFYETVSDPERAQWLAQMGLTIVWSLSAGVVVAAGFWRKRRALRLAGLGLFALTAAKLLLVDTAQVEGGYRIASFLVLGVVMISASYLYHRVERWIGVRQA